MFDMSKKLSFWNLQELVRKLYFLQLAFIRFQGIRSVVLRKKHLKSPSSRQIPRVCSEMEDTTWYPNLLATLMGEKDDTQA